MKTTDIHNLIPSYVKGLVSEKIISDAINYHLKMVKDHPKKEILYFFEKKNTPDNVYIMHEIASKLFYEYCHKFKAYGCNEIYNVLKCKKIPKEVVRFYVEQKQGGSTQLEIIANVYKISNRFTEDELMQIENYNKRYPEESEKETDWLEDIIGIKSTHLQINSKPKQFVSSFDYLELISYQNNLSLKDPEELYIAKTILYNSKTLN